MELERILRSQGFGSRPECRALVNGGRVQVDAITCDDPFAEFAPAGSAVETLENGERGIYATGRTLHVENGGESYRVYTAAGRLVYTGNDSSVTLSTPGMYIVRTGDRSQKVAVK